MIKFRVIFYECEHWGDLDNYISDLTCSGAEILSKDLDEEEESGIVYISVSNKKEFLEEFSKTDSFEFSNLN
jgi:hypothetical protein